MIIVLCEKADKDIADVITQDIAKQYDQLNPSIQLAEEENKWPGKHSWDDLLIVIYGKNEYPESGKSFIREHREFDKKGFILPVACYESNKVPPEPISDIKAIMYDDQALKRITRRVGAMMGLCLRNYDSKIFISYRATDGSNIAQHLNNYLHLYGFQTWLDEAQDLDGETKIQAGQSVEEVIEDNLKTASLVLLVDTPHAFESQWVKKEINIANSQMIPIFPVCIRSAKDCRHGPRFPALANLQRWFPIPIDTDLISTDLISSSLSGDILDHLLKQIEIYLQEIYRRKLRVPHVVERELKEYGFDWRTLDRDKHLYESIKRNLQIKWRILSHCSIYDEVYKPALMAFVDFIKREGCGYKANFKFFIYDGDLLSSDDIEQIVNTDNDFLIFVHTQQLSSFLSSLPSDFKRLLP